MLVSPCYEGLSLLCGKKEERNLSLKYPSISKLDPLVPKVKGA
jgi:hypothetical protein